MKQKTAAKPSALKRIDGTFTKTPEEALIELASTHFPSHKPIKPCSYNKNKIPISTLHDSFGRRLFFAMDFCPHSDTFRSAKFQ